MSAIAALIADMVRAGVDPEIIGRTAAALAEREPVRVVDEQAERRRAADRERKRLRNSAESAEVVVQSPPKKEIPPTPPKEKTTPSTEPNGSSKTRAARLPADWVLPIDWRADALKAGLPEDRIDFEAEKMRDWSISSPNGAKRDWRAAWRNWAKSATERLPRVRGSPPPQQKPRGSDFFDLEAERISERTGSHRSPQGDWDDAQGVPILTIDHHR